MTIPFSTSSPLKAPRRRRIVTRQDWRPRRLSGVAASPSCRCQARRGEVPSMARSNLGREGTRAIPSAPLAGLCDGSLDAAGRGPAPPRPPPRRQTPRRSRPRGPASPRPPPRRRTPRRHQPKGPAPPQRPPPRGPPQLPPPPTKWTLFPQRPGRNIVMERC